MTVGPLEVGGGGGASKFRAAEDSGGAEGDCAFASAKAKATASARLSALMPLELERATDSDLVVMKIKCIE